MPDGRAQESHKIRDIITNKIIATIFFLIFLSLNYFQHYLAVRKIIQYNWIFN